MFYCKTCKQKFQKPKTVWESHGLDHPPYERVSLCPLCGGTDIHPAPTHCRCCGAKLYDTIGEYCCEKCRLRGEEMWRLERKKRKKQEKDPLYLLVRETEEYNRKNGTRLSYGQFVFIKEESRHV